MRLMAKPFVLCRLNAIRIDGKIGNLVVTERCVCVYTKMTNKVLGKSP